MIDTCATGGSDGSIFAALSSFQQRRISIQCNNVLLSGQSAPKDYEILRCCHAGDGDPAAVCRSGTGGKRILYYLSDHGLSVDQYKNDFWQTVDQNAGRRQGTQNGICGKKGEFNKFSYFLDKTSIPVKMVGYIAMKRDEYEADKEEYLGCLEELEQLIRENNLDQIYIIQKHGEELPFTQQYVDICIDMGVTVRLVVDFYKRRRAYSYVSTVGTYPVITYHTISLNTYEMAIKRLMDIIGGMVGILLFSPVMLVTAVAIKLDSPGSVIFKQTRVGQNGRNFKIYKFRSMYIDAEGA